MFKKLLSKKLNSSELPLDYIIMKGLRPVICHGQNNWHSRSASHVGLIWRREMSQARAATRLVSLEQVFRQHIKAPSPAATRFRLADLACTIFPQKAVERFEKF
ncbi:unnamed protein product, partial [Brenthis ino]